MHLASRTTSRNRGAAGHQNLCLTSHTKNSVCRTTAKQPLRGACLICKNKLSRFAEQKLFAATVPLVAWAVSSYDTKIWLVIFVTGGSSRLHLVVVTRSPFCRFLFLTLSVSWSHSSLPLFILGLVALSSSLSFSSSPQTLPTFSSAPHMRHCAAPTFPPPLLPFLRTLTPSLLTPPRPGSAGPDCWRVTTLSLACPGSFCIRDWDRNHTLTVLWLWEESIC